MRGVARKSVDFAGGAQMAGGQDWVTCEGQLVVVDGDPVESHPPFPPHTSMPPMIASSDWFTIDGIKVVAEGDIAVCGHATTGSGFWRIP